ncbi:MAG: arginine--tRNA ligase, partial [Pseudomonadota bacterium]
MNVFDYFEQEVRKIVQDIDLPDEALNLVSRISVEPPRDASHGDMATNAAMVLAKPAKRNPREIAGL